MKDKRVGPNGGTVKRGMPSEKTDRAFLNELWSTYRDKLGYAQVDEGPIWVYCHSGGNDATIFAISGLKIYVPMCYVGHSTSYGLESGIDMVYDLRQNRDPMPLMKAILKMHEINNGEYRLRGYKERM